MNLSLGRPLVVITLVVSYVLLSGCGGNVIDGSGATGEGGGGGGTGGGGGSDASDDSGSCLHAAGDYSLANQCSSPPNTQNCTVSQSICQLTVTCEGQGSFTATATATQVSFNIAGPFCTATVDTSGNWNGTCAANPPCTFTATKK